MNKLARKLTHWTLRNFSRHRWTIRRGKSPLMHVGICLNNRISRFSPFLRVAGDEFVAVELGEALAQHCPEVGSWRLYDAKESAAVSADLVIVLWPDYPPIIGKCGQKVLWLQNGGWSARLPQLQEQFNIVFCASKQLCERFPGLVYLPVACTNTTLYRPLPPHRRFADQVCFIGNYSKAGRSRAHAARFMLPATDFRFAIWGSGWEQAEPASLRQFYRGRLPVKLSPLAHSSCEVFLSYHSQVHRQDDMPSGRTFDALACEAFVISDYMPSLDLFERYVVFTTGGEDLREKLHYYVTHPEERHAKAHGAHAFILGHHTNAHRAKELARVLGFTWRDDVSLDVSADSQPGAVVWSQHASRG